MKLIYIWKNYNNTNKITNKPVFYYKPETCLLLNNRPFYLPEFADKILCNIEPVIKINKVGKYIQEKFAHTYYNEIGISINFSSPDLQKECLKNKCPLDISYSFEGSSPVSAFFPTTDFKNIKNLNFTLKINDKTVINSNTKDLIFSFDRIISFISEFMMLKTGDLIFSGPAVKGINIYIDDKIEAFLNEECLINMKIK
jgi:acylpyruvate hydrolase